MKKKDRETRSSFALDRAAERERERERRAGERERKRETWVPLFRCSLGRYRYFGHFESTQALYINIRAQHGWPPWWTDKRAALSKSRQSFEINQ